MFQKKFFSSKKAVKGFTLVEIIVVLVILAILAAATIPSMLGFVNDAKKKSHTSEVKAVYTAAQAYATEHFAKGDLDANKLNGEINSEHVLHNLLQNDATGRIFGIKVENGKVKSFTYVKGDISYDYTAGGSVKSSDYVSSATFDVGQEVNKRMKILAGNPNATCESVDNNIKGIVKATSDEFSSSYVDTDGSILSADGSDCKIYAWYAGNKIYYYTGADTIFLNEDSANLFFVCEALNDISGLQGLNTSNVTNLNSIFNGCQLLNDISTLSDWDTSNVTNFRAVFCGCSILSDISVLSNWNTSNVTNLRAMFSRCSVLSDISAISGWDISSVSDLGWMFNDTNISDASVLDGWNTTSVSDKEGMFDNTPAKTNEKLPSWY